jgi:hypothetical protein
LVRIGDGASYLLTAAFHDQVGTSANPLDPGLDPKGLQNNGGPTRTIALLAGSRAIDAGDDSNYVTIYDQRGQPRWAGAHIDIGAFEFQPPKSQTVFGRRLY